MGRRWFQLFYIDFQLFYFHTRIIPVNINNLCSIFRCGMIYLDPLQLGWDPLIKSWMENELPQNLNDEQKETIKV